MQLDLKLASIFWT